MSSAWWWQALCYTGANCHPTQPCLGHVAEGKGRGTLYIYSCATPGRLDCCVCLDAVPATMPKAVEGQEWNSLKAQMGADCHAKGGGGAEDTLCSPVEAAMGEKVGGRNWEDLGMPHLAPTPPACLIPWAPCHPYICLYILRHGDTSPYLRLASLALTLTGWRAQNE